MVNCEFSDLSDEMIRDQLVEKTLTPNFHKLDRYAKRVLVIVVDLQCTSPITPGALQKI